MKVREYIEAIETFGVITNYKGRKDRKAVSRVICIRNKYGDYVRLLKLTEKEYQGELTIGILDALIDTLGAR